MCLHFTDCAAFEVNHSHHLHEILQRVEIGNDLRPMRHTVDGSEQPAQDNEDQHVEEDHEHGLLHGFGIVRDNKPKTRHNENVDGSKEVNCPETSLRI